MSTGVDLYRLVEAYAAVDGHRTGTPGDVATRTWFGDELRARGATVTESAYDFPAFTVHEHEVTVDGRPVESEPLWYAGDGAVHGDDVERRHVDLGTRPSFDAAPGRPVVVSTGPTDLLAVPNRPPGSTSPRPHALVPGGLRAMLPEADVTVRTRTSRGTGTSAVVVGRMGVRLAAPVVVVTPLSGWFACAGERGTGIAVTLHLAERLAEHLDVLVVGTTGHEIGHLGVEHALASGLLGTPTAVVHVGASVGAGVPDEAGVLGFAPERWTITDQPTERCDPLREAVAVAGYERVLHSPPDWFGEGEVLKRLGVPLLSFLGLFPLFHTPQDLPAASTSPALMERAAAGVLGGTLAHLAVAA